jgi:hypothetical protein
VKSWFRTLTSGGTHASCLRTPGWLASCTERWISGPFRGMLRAHFNLLCRRTVRNGKREPSTLNTSLVQHVFKLYKLRYRSCVVVQLAGGSRMCGDEIAVYIVSAQGLLRLICVAYGIDYCYTCWWVCYWLSRLYPAFRTIRRSEHALLGPADTMIDTTVKSLQVSVVDSEHRVMFL